MKPKSIDPNMTMDEIMRRWPVTIRVMIHHGMLCIGCPIGIFHTVADACAAHGIDEARFSKALFAAMEQDPLANAPSAFEADTARREPTDTNGGPHGGPTCSGGSPRSA